MSRGNKTAAEVHDTGDRYRVRAVERVADILDALQDSDAGVTLGALAEATGVPKSSVFRYLATLEARGYVVKSTHNGRYTVGLALPSQRRYFELLGSRLRPLLEELRDRFGETVNLGVLDGNRVVYQEIIESRQAMRMAARRGERDYLHCTALGKAIAATLEEEALRRLLSTAGMPAKTGNTIVDVERYVGALEQVRADGYAIDDEENEEGARCVAVALVGFHVPVGVSVSGPAVRLPLADAAKLGAALVQEVPRLVRGAAAAVHG